MQALTANNFFFFKDYKILFPSTSFQHPFTVSNPGHGVLGVQYPHGQNNMKDSPLCASAGLHAITFAIILYSEAHSLMLRYTLETGSQRCLCVWQYASRDHPGGCPCFKKQKGIKCLYFY